MPQVKKGYAILSKFSCGKRPLPQGDPIVPALKKELLVREEEGEKGPS